MSIYEKKGELTPLQSGVLSERLDISALLRKLENRQPMAAYNNPDFHWKERLMMLSGEFTEAFRDRRHVVRAGVPEYVTLQIKGQALPSNVERRQFDRIRLTNVGMEVTDSRIELVKVTPYDVSFGGCSFEAERETDLRTGMKVGTRICFGKEELLLPGVIAHVRESGTRLLVGMTFELQFAAEAADSLSRLMRYCETNREPGDDQSEAA